MTSRLLTAVSILFILLAGFSFWISDNIYDSNNFKKNVLTAFKKQETRDAIAGEIVDRILADNPSLQQIASSPAESAISGMMNSPYLENVIEKAAEKLQQYITTGQQEVSLELAPINNLLTAVAKATGNTDQTPQIKNTDLVILPANAFPRLNTWLKPITTAGPILGVLGIIMLIYVTYRANDRLAAIKTVGIYLLIGTVLNILLLPFISSLIRQNASSVNAGVIASETFNTFALSYLYMLLVFLVIAVLLILVPSFSNRYLRGKRIAVTSESNK